MILTEIERLQLVAVRDNIYSVLNTLQIAHVNLQALLDIAAVQGVSVDGTEILSTGTGQLTSLNNHAWTFGELVEARGAKINRDGTWYAQGVAVLLTIKDGVVWAKTSDGFWFSEDGDALAWTSHQTNGPF